MFVKTFLTPFISIALSILFIATQVLAVPTQISSPQNTDLEKSLSQLMDIKEYFKGENQDPIIIVEDAHQLVSAQKQILQLLSSLQKKSQRKLLVGVEGMTKGSLIPPSEKGFTKEEIRSLKPLIKTLFMSGQLSASEFFYHLEPRHVEFYGTEDFGLYEKNRLNFISAYEMAQKNKSKFDQIEGLISSLKESYFHSDILMIENILKSLSSVDIISFFENISLKYELRFQDYPSIMSLIDYYKFKKQILASQEFNQQIAFYAKIKGIDTETAIQNLDQLKVGDLSEIESGELERYVTLNNKMKEFSGYSTLIDELMLLRLRVAYESMDSPFLVAAFEVVDYLEIMTNLRDLEVLPSQYVRFKELSMRWSLSSIQDWLILHDSDYRFTFPLYELSVWMKDAVLFYEEAFQRDRIIIQNLLSRHTKVSDFLPVLIIGGFHTNGVTNFLKEEDISYYVLRPSLTLDETNSKHNYIRTLSNNFVIPVNLNPSRLSPALSSVNAQNINPEFVLYDIPYSLMIQVANAVKSANQGEIDVVGLEGIIKEINQVFNNWSVSVGDSPDRKQVYINISPSSENLEVNIEGSKRKLILDSVIDQFSNPSIESLDYLTEEQNQFRSILLSRIFSTLAQSNNFKSHLKESILNVYDYVIEDGAITVKSVQKVLTSLLGDRKVFPGYRGFDLENEEVSFLNFGGGTGSQVSLQASNNVFNKIIIPLTNNLQKKGKVLSVQSNVDDGGSSYKQVKAFAESLGLRLPPPGDQVNALFNSFLAVEQTIGLLDNAGRLRKSLSGDFMKDSFYDHIVEILHEQSKLHGTIDPNTGELFYLPPHYYHSARNILSLAKVADEKFFSDERVLASHNDPSGLKGASIRNVLLLASFMEHGIIEKSIRVVKMKENLDLEELEEIEIEKAELLSKSVDIKNALEEKEVQELYQTALNSLAAKVGIQNGMVAMSSFSENVMWVRSEYSTIFVEDLNVEIKNQTSTSDLKNARVRNLMKYLTYEENENGTVTFKYRENEYALKEGEESKSLNFTGNSTFKVSNIKGKFEVTLSYLPPMRYRLDVRSSEEGVVTFRYPQYNSDGSEIPNSTTTVKLELGQASEWIDFRLPGQEEANTQRVFIANIDGYPTVTVFSKATDEIKHFRLVEFDKNRQSKPWVEDVEYTEMQMIKTNEILQKSHQISGRVQELDSVISPSVDTNAFKAMNNGSGMLIVNSSQLAKEHGHNFFLTGDLGLAGRDFYKIKNGDKTNLMLRPRLTIMQTNITETISYSKPVDAGIMGLQNDITRDTSKSETYYQIADAGKKITANESIVKLIKNTTDFISFGPGSVLTSLMPYFMSEEIVEALIEKKLEGKVPIVFIFNFNRDNETVDMEALEVIEFINNMLRKHSRLMEKYGGINFSSVFTDAVFTDLENAKKNVLKVDPGAAKLFDKIDQTASMFPEDNFAPGAASKYGKFKRGELSLPDGDIEAIQNILFPGNNVRAHLRDDILIKVTDKDRGTGKVKEFLGYSPESLERVFSDILRDYYEKDTLKPISFYKDLALEEDMIFKSTLEDATIENDFMDYFDQFQSETGQPKEIVLVNPAALTRMQIKALAQMINRLNVTVKILDTNKVNRVAFFSLQESVSSIAKVEYSDSIQNVEEFVSSADAILSSHAYIYLFKNLGAKLYEVPHDEQMNNGLLLMLPFASLDLKGDSLPSDLQNFGRVNGFKQSVIVRIEEFANKVFRKYNAPILVELAA